MRERTLAIEMIPGSCAAACHSCPVGRDKPIKPGELERMAGIASAIRGRVSDRLHTVVSMNTPHHRIENLQALHPLLAKTDSLMLTFGRGLNDGIEQHGKGNIEIAAQDFIDRVQRDLESASALPDRLTICIHLTPEESFDDLILLEAWMIKKFLGSGLIGKTERGIKKINFRVTKNDMRREEVDVRNIEISQKFMHWKEKPTFGPLSDLVMKTIFTSGYLFARGPVRVGVNQILIGSHIFDNPEIYWLTRGDSLSISQKEKKVCDLEWDYRFIHQRGTFGVSESPEKTLQHKSVSDFTLVPNGEVHFGHNAMTMLRPELRFSEAEFDELLAKGKNIIALTKKAVRRRIKAISL